MPVRFSFISLWSTFCHVDSIFSLPIFKGLRFAYKKRDIFTIGQLDSNRNFHRTFLVDVCRKYVTGNLMFNSFRDTTSRTFKESETIKGISCFVDDIHLAKNSRIPVLLFLLTNLSKFCWVLIPLQSLSYFHAPEKYQNNVQWKIATCIPIVESPILDPII